MFCEKCGNQMPDTAAFCEKCGEPTGVADTAKADSTAAVVKDRHKKIITVAAVLLAVATAAIIGTVAIQATPANRVKRQLRLAQKYLNELNYEQAVLAYQEAISIDPKCEQAYFAIADICIKTNEEDKAVAILEQAQANMQTDALTARLDEVRKQAAAAKEARGESGSAGQNSNQGTSPTQPSASGITPANAGEIITFGTYEQDNNTGNGAEPIEWLVLDNQGDRMLVISRYGLDSQEYNERRTSVTWETCGLRSWLNSEFYNTAFSDSEKALIRTTTLSNPDNAKYNTSGGNATNDNVFCLSIDEAKAYFGINKAREAKPTAYAVAKGAYAATSAQWYGGNCYWWLRSPGNYQSTAAYVDISGDVNEDGHYVYLANFAVRPALWIGL